jgi:hypothetical protein
MRLPVDMKPTEKLFISTRDPRIDPEPGDMAQGWPHMGFGVTDFLRRSHRAHAPLGGGLSESSFPR